MGSKAELVRAIEQVAEKVDFAKLRRLGELTEELTGLDELLGHNAETARDQLMQRAESYLSSMPPALRHGLEKLLPRITSETLLVALRLLTYGFPVNVTLFMHINDVLEKSDTPTLFAGASVPFRLFLEENPNIHVVILSHESADVTAILAGGLVGKEPVARGQVSMIYESGMGVYIGSDPKEKKDLTKGMRTEVLHVMERMAIAAASRMHDASFHEKFYFTSTEYSVGIRVHPFARGTNNTLDKEAARELVGCLSVALADLVKEDVKAVEAHIVNYCLNTDASLKVIFEPVVDERVWDVEKVDEYLRLLSLVHLGSRGSLVRPADASDVVAAEAIIGRNNTQSLIVTTGENSFTLPLMQWTRHQESGVVACSESATDQVLQEVESQGGIQYSSGHLEELLQVLDAYVNIAKLLG